MTTNDLVLSLETCQRLKSAGFEFPESVFCWYRYPEATDMSENYAFVRDGIDEDWIICDTLTLHEVYCWLNAEKYPELRYAISSTNPLLAAERYINNLLDAGVLKA